MLSAMYLIGQCRGPRRTASRGDAVVDEDDVVKSPPLHWGVVFDFGPFRFQDLVERVVAGAAAVAFADVDDPVPRVGTDGVGPVACVVGRPRQQEGHPGPGSGDRVGRFTGEHRRPVLDTSVPVVLLGGGRVPVIGEGEHAALGQ
jgi:hypothetical protein